MIHWIQRARLVVALAATWAVLPTSDCQAGPFLDWLLGRTAYYYPLGTTAYYPPPTLSPPSVWAPSCAPNPLPAQPNYTTTVRYRSTWVPVPVTRYSPVAGVDPATGCPSAALQPCNTYTWQLRRVPVVSYRPTNWWWPRGLCGYSPPPMTMPMTMPTLCPTDPCADPCAPASTLPYCAPTVPYAAPTPGATVAPGAPSGAGTLPAPVPADIPPSLRSETMPQTNSPPVSIAPPSPSNGRAAATPGAASPAVPGAYSRSYDLKPIPDKEADPPKLPSLQAPQLLKPGERTALREPWVVLPISWPISPKTPAQLPAATAAPVRAHYDDGGWVSDASR